MSAPVLRPLSAGEVLDVSFGVYRAHFVPLVTIAAMTRVVPDSLGIYVERSGGLLENIPRVLPEGMEARLERRAWHRDPLFDWLAATVPKALKLKDKDVRVLHGGVADVKQMVLIVGGLLAAAVMLVMGLPDGVGLGDALQLAGQGTGVVSVEGELDALELEHESVRRHAVEHPLQRDRTGRCVEA